MSQEGRPSERRPRGTETGNFAQGGPLPSLPGVCDCGKRVSRGEFLCEACGRPQGWEPVFPPKREAISDLTCPNCPDVLIPGKAFFYLQLAGTVITCPLCGTELFSPDDCTWDLSSFDTSPHLADEESVLSFGKQWVDVANFRPELTQNWMLANEVQYAGRLLLRWMERSSPVSDRVARELARNWAGHMLMLQVTEGNLCQVSSQGLRDAFLIRLHYSGVLFRQIEIRLPVQLVGYGLRAEMLFQLVEEMYRPFEEVSGQLAVQFKVLEQFPYDARLLCQEMRALKKKEIEVRRRRGDVKEAGRAETRLQEWDCYFDSSIPVAGDAVGCLRRKPRRVGDFPVPWRKEGINEGGTKDEAATTDENLGTKCPRCGHYWDEPDWRCPACYYEF